MILTSGETSPQTIEDFLRQDEEKEILRFTTAGSVDDGKSTLIGRLLYDSKGVYEDQLASVRKRSVNGASMHNGMDLSLLTDGLRAEREQGITIDVAYRYFATPKRKFIIADTPGHEQYTRNMATGASTANLAIILVDARKGVMVQSRRHAFISSLLGIPHIVVAVNKMDLVDYSEEVYEQIRAEFTGVAAQLNISDVEFIPISALKGDNVVSKMSNMDWYQGPTLMHHLETVHIASDRNLLEMRFPVQYVLRPNQDFRGYAGQLASGVLRQGDSVIILPSGRTSKVKQLISFDGPLEEAYAPMSLTVTLDDEIDVSRGDMLAPPLHAPQATRQFDARLIWFNEAPLDSQRQYLLKHTTRVVKSQVVSVRYRVDMSTLEKETATKLSMNEIGAVVIETHQPIFCDPYKRNHATGSFILLDPLTNATMAAGMITGRHLLDVEIQPQQEVAAGPVSAWDRQRRTGHRSLIVSLSASSRTQVEAVERLLFEAGCLVNVLQGSLQPGQAKAVAQAVLRMGGILLCPGNLSASDSSEIQQQALPEQWCVLHAGEPGSLAEEIRKRIQLAPQGR